jgi:hypothetical protein
MDCISFYLIASLNSGPAFPFPFNIIIYSSKSYRNKIPRSELRAKRDERSFGLT